MSTNWGQYLYSMQLIMLMSCLDVCRISKNSALATVIREARLIVWDELAMANRHMVEAVDRLLRDLMQSTAPFGGKVCVLGGDFRQVLGVVKHGSRAQTVNASPKRSRLWAHVRVMKLKENMRVSRASGEDAIDKREFADYLLEVGEGRVAPAFDDPSRPFAIRLRSDFVSSSESVTDLLDEVYGTEPARLQDGKIITSRAIMTPRNTDVDMLNEVAARHLAFPGEVSGMSQSCMHESAGKISNVLQQHM